MAELRTLLKPDETVKLYAVSVDNPRDSREFAEKIDSDSGGQVAFALLSDPECRTIDAYGLRDPAYAGQPKEGIPHPAVYVIDGAGRVTWARVVGGGVGKTYRRRLESLSATSVSPRAEVVKINKDSTGAAKRYVSALTFPPPKGGYDSPDSKRSRLSGI